MHRLLRANLMSNHTVGSGLTYSPVIRMDQGIPHFRTVVSMCKPDEVIADVHAVIYTLSSNSAAS